MSWNEGRKNQREREIEIRGKREGERELLYKYFSTRFFLTTFCKLFKLNHWEFPYITLSSSIFRKVFWGTCRSKLFDKSLERERELMKKKLFDSRKIKHKIFHKPKVPLTEDYRFFPVLVIIRGRMLAS